MFKCLDSGVDLSYIVKAPPAAPSNEEQEEQMHEILQVSFVPFRKDIYSQSIDLFLPGVFMCRFWIPSEIGMRLLMLWI